jgi:choice-of-anchor C domain-containing protein
MNRKFSQSYSLLTTLFMLSLTSFSASNVHSMAVESERNFLPDKLNITRLAGNVDLVLNGNFEEPVVSSGTFKTYRAGQTFGSWTVSEGQVDHISGLYFQVANGGQSLDLNACSPAIVYQDIPANVGRHYLLEFIFSGNAMGGPTVKQMEIWWGAKQIDTITFDVTGYSKENMGWNFYQYEILNVDSVARLSFKSLTPGCYGPVIDAISLYETPQIFLPIIYAGFSS